MADKVTKKTKETDSKHARAQTQKSGLFALLWAILGKYRAEILTVAAWVAGWALVTWTVAALTTVWAWPASAGLLLMGLSGYRFMGRVMLDGLYMLTRPESKPETGQTPDSPSLRKGAKP